MRFDNLHFTTTSIDPLVQFYGTDLGCSLVEHTRESLTVDAGSTRLTFDADPDANATLYHVAFTVDADIHAVVNWLTDRAEILSVDEELSVTSKFIEADMVYFLDPVGNILEFVCPVGRTGDFDPSAVRCVCEVGLPVEYPPAIADTLTDTFGIPVWGDASETFIRVGDIDGRFIISALGRHWFPTDTAAVAAPLGVTLASNQYNEWTPPDLPYRVVTSAASVD